MRKLFVDTAYWVAQLNTTDQWHHQSLAVESQLVAVSLVTSELVLVELLNYFCNFGGQVRQRTSIAAQEILSNPRIQVVWQTQSLFLAGLDLYKARLDKGYSLTDCVSMVVMQQEGISEILTHDKHFAQEGFTILL